MAAYRRVCLAEGERFRLATAHLLEILARTGMHVLLPGGFVETLVTQRIKEVLTAHQSLLAALAEVPPVRVAHLEYVPIDFEHCGKISVTDAPNATFPSFELAPPPLA